MKIKRRDFIKGCTAACVLLLPGITNAMNASKTGNAKDTERVEKSVRASFGGGFSVQAHKQSNGWTHARIEHLGNQYMVASADLYDWKVIGSI